MKKIKFTYQRGWNDYKSEVFEFEDEDDESVIEEAFQDWVWNEIGDYFCWEEIE